VYEIVTATLKKRRRPKDDEPGIILIKIEQLKLTSAEFEYWKNSNP
jgi:hypothetical protein